MRNLKITAQRALVVVVVIATAMLSLPEAFAQTPNSTEVTPSGTIDASSGLAEVAIRNGAGQPIAMNVWLDGTPELLDAVTVTAGTVACEISGTRITCPELSLGGGETASVTLTTAGFTIPDDDSVAILTVRSSAGWLPGGTASAHKIEFGSPKAEPKAAADTWTQATEWGPGAGSRSFEIPLNASVPCADLALPAAETRIGSVTSGDTIAFVVAEACVDNEAGDEARALSVSIDDLPGHGATSYEGKIDLTPTETTGGVVTLKINQRSNFLFPLLMLLFAIAAALLLNYWRTARAVTSSLKEATVLIAAKVGDPSEDPTSVLAAFQQETGLSPDRFNLQNAVRNETARIRGELSTAARSKPFTLSSDDENVQTLADDIADLKALVDDWPTFGNKFARLRDAVKEPDIATELPKFVETAQAKIINANPTDLEALIELTQITETAQAVAEDWPRTSARMKRAARRVTDLERAANLDLNETEIKDLQEARSGLSHAQQQFLIAESADDVAATRSGVLKDALSHVDRLAAIVVDDQIGLNAAPGMTPSIPLLADLSPLDLLRGPKAADYASTLRRIDISINWVIFVVLLAVTVFTGFVALYVGKQWGSPLDFVTAALWGITGGLAAVPLSAAIESLATRTVGDAAKA